MLTCSHKLVLALFGNSVLFACPVSASYNFVREGGEKYVADRETGTVKWFNSSKGYGFIVRDQGEDIFVHYSAISGEGYRALEEGQRVEFSIGEGDKGVSTVRPTSRAFAGLITCKHLRLPHRTGCGILRKHQYSNRTPR
jgi:CspA family cold shock protein